METVTTIVLSNCATNNIHEEVASEPVFTNSNQYEMILANTPNLLKLSSRKDLLRQSTSSPWNTIGEMLIGKVFWLFDKVAVFAECSNFSPLPFVPRY